jgi:hypothetical protein
VVKSSEKNRCAEITGGLGKTVCAANIFPGHYLKQARVERGNACTIWRTGFGNICIW